MLELYGKYLDQGRQANLWAVVGNWKDLFADIRFLREDNRDGKTIFRLQMTGGDAPPITVLVDFETGDIQSVGIQILRLGSASQLPEAAIYKDYREVNGIRFLSRSHTATTTWARLFWRLKRLKLTSRTKTFLSLSLGSPSTRNNWIYFQSGNLPGV